MAKINYLNRIVPVGKEVLSSTNISFTAAGDLLYAKKRMITGVLPLARISMQDWPG